MQHSRFCQDQEYHQGEQASLFLPHHHDVILTIPQLDGGPMFSNFADQWSCKCCTYDTFFDTEDKFEPLRVQYLLRTCVGG